MWLAASGRLALSQVPSRPLQARLAGLGPLEVLTIPTVHYFLGAHIAGVVRGIAFDDSAIDVPWVPPRHYYWRYKPDADAGIVVNTPPCALADWFLNSSPYSVYTVRPRVVQQGASQAGDTVLAQPTTVRRFCAGSAGFGTMSAA